MRPSTKQAILRPTAQAPTPTGLGGGGPSRDSLPASLAAGCSADLPTLSRKGTRRMEHVRPILGQRPRRRQQRNRPCVFQEILAWCPTDLPL